MLRAMKKLALACLVVLLACQKSAPAADSTGTPSPGLASGDLTAMPGEHPKLADGTALPPGHPPIDGTAAPGPALNGQAFPPGHPSVGAGEPAREPAAPGTPSAPPPKGPASAGGLTWEGALPLVRRTPKSEMRAAEYGLAGDERAELSVFYFGPGAAGGVDANIERWLGQFSQADGSETAKKAKRGERKVSGITVNTVEVTGNFGGSMGGGGGSDYMLLGAIASGPSGAVFFKLTGPRPSVERARTAFDTMISSLHPEAPAAH